MSPNHKKLFIEEKHLQELKTIIAEHYPKALVWAYGSRVNGTAHAGSDLDLAIVDYGQQENDYLELKEALQESNIPFLIDIFELNRLPQSFQEQIKKSYIVLSDGKETMNKIHNSPSGVNLEVLDYEE